MDNEREKIDFDVLFVGGGPASLAGAIRLMQRMGLAWNVVDYKQRRRQE